jgi:hypothetical protein
VWGVGCGEKGAGSREQGETIDNLRVNHTIKNGFSINPFLKTDYLFSPFCMSA